jgi:hypothetical protein
MAMPVASAVQNRESRSRAASRLLRAGSKGTRTLFQRRWAGRREKPKPFVRCTLGTVLDVSAGGLRLRTRQRLRGDVLLRLRVSGREYRVRAETVWTRRLGLLRYNNGLRFLDIMPREAAEILGLEQ